MDPYTLILNPGVKNGKSRDKRPTHANVKVYIIV